MSCRTLMMIAVIVLDLVFVRPTLHGAEVPDLTQMRMDFKNGLGGDQAALDRAMKESEQILSQDPKNAIALVWHGVGLIKRGGDLFESGKPDAAGPLYERGMEQVYQAVALQPNNPGVLIPRGATLIAATLYMPTGDRNTELLRTGLTDFLMSAQAMKPEWDHIDPTLRGRVLFGIADAYHRLGEEENAMTYFQRTVNEAKGTGYAKEAQVYISTKTLSKEQELCKGCDSAP